MHTLIENKHVLINALLFQVLWFVAILGQNMWSLMPLALMLVHFFIIGNKQFLGIVSLAFLGILIDSAFNFAGIYHFSTASLTLPYINLPVWLASLWLGFCLCLPISLAWLLKKPYLLIIACSLMGPISYLAGRRLGALSFSDANVWLLVLEWCMFSIIVLIVLFPKLGEDAASPLFSKKKSLC